MERPAGPASGTQNWRDLLFVHWAYPPDVLRPFIPAPLELDVHDGLAYVGVVPFAMEDVRPAALPKALAMNFLETNVRTYVTHLGRAGVYFFSLDASSLLAVKAARWGWGLPYFHATMSIDRDRVDQIIDYETSRNDLSRAMHRARYRIGRMLGASAPGTLAYFLLERYFLFTVKNGLASRGQVHHVPYPAQDVELLLLEDDLIEAAGLPEPHGPPVAAHYAAGVDVEVFGPW